MESTIVVKLVLASVAWAWSLLSTSSNWPAAIIATIVFVKCFVSLDLTRILQTIVKTLCGIFFREIVTVDTHNVPITGPVIFVCSPHSNQLADPTVVLTSLYSKRAFSFVVASVTLRRPIAGAIAKLFDPIGVERPQDCAYKGKGKISTQHVHGQHLVSCTGASLSDQVKCGFTIRVSMKVGNKTVKCQAVVKSVDPKSDSALMAMPFMAKDEPGQNVEFTDQPFQVIPVIDHVRMFSNVYEKLGGGGCIGIFPEGGSHDQPTMLPFKPGVAKMALGTICTHPETHETLRIVPVGLAYSNKHRFRSRAAITFGTPIAVRPDLVAKYTSGVDADKKDALADLLGEIRTGCEKVSLHSDSSDTLLNFPLLHSIYRHEGCLVEYPIEKKIKFSQSLCNDYRRVKDDQLVQEVMSYTAVYRKAIRKLRIRDHSLQRILKVSKHTALMQLFFIAIKVALMFILYLPIVVISLPLYLLVEVLAHRQARKAKEGSTVKITGEDVLASAKVMIFLTFYPLLHLGFAGLTLWLFPQHLVSQFVLSPIILYFATTNGIQRFQGYRRAFMLYWSVVWHQQQVVELFQLRKSIKEKLHILCDGNQNWGRN